MGIANNKVIAGRGCDHKLSHVSDSNCPVDHTIKRSSRPHVGQPYRLSITSSAFGSVAPSVISAPQAQDGISEQFGASNCSITAYDLLAPPARLSCELRN